MKKIASFQMMCQVGGKGNDFMTSVTLALQEKFWTMSLEACYLLNL